MGEVRRRRRAEAREAGVPFEPHYHAGPKVQLLRQIHALVDAETAYECETELAEYQKLNPGLTWDVWIAALLTSAVNRARVEREAAQKPAPKTVLIEPYTPERAAEIVGAQG